VHYRNVFRSRLVAAVAAALVVGAGVLALPQGAASAASPALTTPYDGTGTNGIADPGVVRATVNGTTTFVSVSTGGAGKIDVWTSSDGDASGPWTLYGKNQLQVPGWVDTTQAIWAPDEIQLPSGPLAGQWALFYSAERQTGANEKRCIGLAIGATAVGPFVPQGTAPFICPAGSNVVDNVPNAPDPSQGVIDPTARLLWYNHAQGLFLTYKTTSTPSSIQMAHIKINQNPIGVFEESNQTSQKLTQFSGNQENPVLVQRGGSSTSDGTYTLFTSQGDYQTCSYNTVWRSSTNLWSWSGSGTAMSFPGDTICGHGDADIVPDTAGTGWRIFFSGRYQAGKTLAQAQNNTNPPFPFHLYVGVLAFNGNTPSVSKLIAR
jgi:hypothetical protein